MNRFVKQGFSGRYSPLLAEPRSRMLCRSRKTPAPLVLVGWFKNIKALDFFFLSKNSSYHGQETRKTHGLLLSHSPTIQAGSIYTSVSSGFQAGHFQLRKSPEDLRIVPGQGRVREGGAQWGSNAIEPVLQRYHSLQQKCSLTPGDQLQFQADNHKCHLSH